MDGALRHPGVDIILNMEVGPSKYVNTELRDNQAREFETQRSPGEGGVDLTQDREL